MPTFLEIAVNVPQVSEVFHYHLPSELEGRVRIGHLVLVPFGSRTVQGIVLKEVEQPEVLKTRPVLELVDEETVVTQAQISLAYSLAHDCLAPLPACLGLMIPPGIDQQADVLYTPQGDIPAGLSVVQTRLLKLLHKRGPLRSQQIDRSMPRTNWRAALKPLITRGLITSEAVLPQPKVKPKMVRTVSAACTAQQATLAYPNLGKIGAQAHQRRQGMLDLLLKQAKPVEVSWLYKESGGNAADLKMLVDRGLVTLGEEQVWRDPILALENQPPEIPDLTSDQRAIWQEVQHNLQQTAAGIGQPAILLHGVTGSGKTEIYLQAVQEALQTGRQAIILVPEIALTPQTVRRFVARFPGKVGLIHSGLSAGERYDTWRRARAGEFQVVVGPRSALFTPFSNIGLIVIDECHDDSYYQSEASPHYHAREAALVYARQLKATCLLGSATPDITSMYHSQQGSWQYLHLPNRILAHRKAVQEQLERLKTWSVPQEQTGSRYQHLENQADAIDLPPVSLVDMRIELQAGNRSIFSRPLQAALQNCLEQEQQAILFLNRRGSATYVFCRDCGQTLQCPHCDIPLTYHEAQIDLRCHYCGYHRRMPEKCPACGSTRIRQYGAGTQKVETEVNQLFPQARTLRWDHETTRKKGAHDDILKRFAQRGADILVGTQMLAKGLDLPLVTLVGVVLADVGLSLPDYRTNERAFQVLTQVAGRAGRSPLGGKVIMQTFQPEHYVIQAASRHDYTAFYEKELASRQKLGYPPFTRLVRMEYRHTDAAKVERAAIEMAGRLKSWIEEENLRATRMIGPAPCFFDRISGYTRWQIILAGPDPVKLLRGRSFPEWKIEVNPPNLL